MKKRWVSLVFVLFLALLMTGCLPGNGSYSADQPAGFFSGIWHGWIAPLSLILSIFNPDIRVYEPLNTGWWYDFAFYVAIVGGFGTISLTRKKK